MGSRIPLSVLGLLLVGQTLSGTVWAQTKGEDIHLQTLQRALDREMGVQGSEGMANVQVQTVAREFHVPPDLLQDMQGAKQPWGEVTIELAMADALSKANAGFYPTAADALKRVQQLRNQNLSWNQVAQELGINLSQVRRAVQSTLQELQGERERLQHRRRAEQAVDTAPTAR